MAGWRAEDRSSRERLRRDGLMLDIRAIRERPDFFQAELAKVGYGESELKTLLAADEERRRLIHEVERRRAERAKGSREIGRSMHDPAERARAVAEMKQAGATLAGLARGVAAAEAAIQRPMLEGPNPPPPAGPPGRGEGGNGAGRTPRRGPPVGG